MGIVILYNVNVITNFKNEYALLCTMYFSKIDLCASLVDIFE